MRTRSCPAGSPTGRGRRSALINSIVLLLYLAVEVVDESLYVVRTFLKLPTLLMAESRIMQNDNYYIPAYFLSSVCRVLKYLLCLSQKHSRLGYVSLLSYLNCLVVERFRLFCKNTLIISKLPLSTSSTSFYFET